MLTQLDIYDRHMNVGIYGLRLAGVETVYLYLFYIIYLVGDCFAELVRNYRSDTPVKNRQFSSRSQITMWPQLSAISTNHIFSCRKQ